MNAVPFMDRMGIVFLASLGLAVAFSLLRPAATGSDRITAAGIGLGTSRGFILAGVALIAILTAFYWAWW